MVIIEGMDGTGKTRLVDRLCGDFDLPLHERASRSKEGPVRELWTWVENDVTTWPTQPLAIYDRHPLVSEYIYGPLTRGWVDPMFYSDVASGMLSTISRFGLVIFCDPGWDDVLANVTDSGLMQMPGVLDNSRKLYLTYKTYRQLYQGAHTVYSYQQGQTAYDRIHRHVSDHLKRWNNGYR